eukprot:CAMPEP_0119472924 /NCGR_PEP_ID=MMETSP1344-20130328/4791_1 /TAXON_ID=236787 /ORGANISM="Florenciella parvula, Strain CCMP2471" /LENGTH=327 /DNA_ID=CAMNT_0007505963 /DNA_START=271 /DNA_END=1250 /DNA_ORIENTATION=-
MGTSNSKMKFKEAIEALSAEDVPREDTDFWDELWRLKTTTEEVWEIISPDDVRRLKKERPQNLHTLFDQAVCQLCQVIQTPLPQYFDQALNCVRVLTRILPFMMEEPDDEWVRQLCWSTVEDSPFGGGGGDGGAKSGDDGDGFREPLGQLVIQAVMHLLFLPSFTVDTDAFENEYEEDEQEEDLDVLHPGAVWAPGIIVPNDIVVLSTTYDKNRVEVLRLMLAMLCEPLFQPADNFDPVRSLWLKSATAIDVPYASLLFYSLLNTVISFDPVGWGVPYGANMSRSGAPARVLEKAAQVLIVLLDHGPSVSTPPAEGEEGEGEGNGGA